jgi:hypothetical protein
MRWTINTGLPPNQVGWPWWATSAVENVMLLRRSAPAEEAACECLLGDSCAAHAAIGKVGSILTPVIAGDS